MSKRNQGLQHRGEREELGILSNDKNNVIVNYLLSYIKGYLKSRIKKLPRKNKCQFSVRRCRVIQDISLLSFLIYLFIYLFIYLIIKLIYIEHQ